MSYQLSSSFYLVKTHSHLTNWCITGFNTLLLNYQNQDMVYVKGKSVGFLTFSLLNLCLSNLNYFLNNLKKLLNLEQRQGFPSYLLLFPLYEMTTFSFSFIVFVAYLCCLISSLSTLFVELRHVSTLNHLTGSILGVLGVFALLSWDFQWCRVIMDGSLIATSGSLVSLQAVTTVLTFSDCS